MNDRNDIAELGLKSRVKICAALQRAEAIAVCEFGEDSDIAAVFKLDACGWQSLSSRSSGECGLKNRARVAMIDGLSRAGVTEDFV